MSREDRLPIFPTRGAMVLLKSRMTSANKGYVSLKRKVDALQIHLRALLARLVSSKIAMGEAVREAEFSLAEMRFVTGETIIPVIIETTSKARTKIRSWEESVAGIKIKVFQSYQDGSDSYELAGLSRGGQQLSAVKLKFSNLINLLVDIASLQIHFATFDEALKLANRRVSVIEHLVLPRLSNTLKYCESELEEFEREEFYRIKKLKEKKKRKAECDKQPEKIPLPPPQPIVKSKCICHV